MGLAFFLFGTRHCDTPIDQTRPVAAVNHDVFGFDVAVNDASAMHCVQADSDLLDQADTLRQRETFGRCWVARDQVSQDRTKIRSLDQFHRKVGLAHPFGIDVMHRRDQRMLQLPHQVRFGQELFLIVYSIGSAIMHSFQCQPTTILVVVTSEQFAAGSFTNFFEQLIAGRDSDSLDRWRIGLGGAFWMRTLHGKTGETLCWAERSDAFQNVGGKACRVGSLGLPDHPTHYVPKKPLVARAITGNLKRFFESFRPCNFFASFRLIRFRRDRYHQDTSNRFEPRTATVTEV